MAELRPWVIIRVPVNTETVKKAAMMHTCNISVRRIEKDSLQGAAPVEFRNNLDKLRNQS